MNIRCMIYQFSEMYFYPKNSFFLSFFWGIAIELPNIGLIFLIRIGIRLVILIRFNFILLWLTCWWPKDSLIKQEVEKIILLLLAQLLNWQSEQQLTD